MAQERIDIILPNRIGDAIMTLPAIVCLKQLLAAFSPDAFRVRLYTHVPIVDILEALDLFEIRRFDLSAKVGSWLSPAGKAFFLTTTSKNIGFHAKRSYGLRMQNKKLIRYDIDTPYLNFSVERAGLPAELVAFLQGECRLPFNIIRSFGICLDLGFTAAQIRSCFTFSEKSLSLPDEFFDWQPPSPAPFVVICMEAAYGSVRHNSDRRWPEEHFFEIAEKVYRDHGCRSVFIGINTEPAIPATDYCIDLRGKLNLKQLTQTLRASCGYIGNDTGPLHLANLVKKPSVGVYARKDYPAPVFGEYNTVVLRPQGMMDVYQHVEKVMTGRGDLSPAVPQDCPDKARSRGTV